MRSSTQRLTHSGWSLGHRRVRRTWARLVVAAAVAGAAGIAGTAWVLWPRQAPPSPSLALATRPLEQALAQARMALQVSDARSHELEREIDSLNQRLRQAQEELAFFRKARDSSKASR